MYLLCHPIQLFVLLLFLPFLLTTWGIWRILSNFGPSTMADDAEHDDNFLLLSLDLTLIIHGDHEYHFHKPNLINLRYFFFFFRWYYFLNGGFWSIASSDSHILTFHGIYNLYVSFAFESGKLQSKPNLFLSVTRKS